MSSAARIGSVPTAFPCPAVTGDRIRVAYGVFGRLGRVCSTSPGHVLVRYDDGCRELVDPTRRPLWVLR
jgi:hypothetical protein